MKYIDSVFTAIIWQPALPDEPFRTELSGSIIRTYVPGEFFPDDWFFRADFNRRGSGKGAPQGLAKGPSWQIAESTRLSPAADDRVPTTDECQESRSSFAQSQLLEGYAALNDKMIAGNYVDLDTARMFWGPEPGIIIRALQKKPEIRTLLVTMDDYIYFHRFQPDERRDFRGLGLEVHFVRRTRIVADDGHDDG